jgi:hypothetical protein
LRGISTAKAQLSLWDGAMALVGRPINEAWVTSKSQSSLEIVFRWKRAAAMRRNHSCCPQSGP